MTETAKCTKCRKHLPFSSFDITRTGSRYKICRTDRVKLHSYSVAVKERAKQVKDGQKEPAKLRVEKKSGEPKPEQIAEAPEPEAEPEPEPQPQEAHDPNKLVDDSDPETILPPPKLKRATQYEAPADDIDVKNLPESETEEEKPAEQPVEEPQYFFKLTKKKPEEQAVRSKSSGWTTWMVGGVAMMAGIVVLRNSGTGSVPVAADPADFYRFNSYPSI